MYIRVGPANVVVSNLLSTFNDPSHQVNDTGVVFQDGSVLFLSRAILASQCQKMIPLLYSSEGILYNGHQPIHQIHVACNIITRTLYEVTF